MCIIVERFTGGEGKAVEDGQIVELYWARSERAIAETDARYGKYCCSIAYNILSSTEDSAECVNDTWLAAWRSMPPKRPSCLAAFLGRLTRNLALNRWRSRRAEKRGGGQLTLALEELGGCAGARNEMEDVEVRTLIVSVLDRFLASLPKRDRMVFVRRYWYFSPVAEIAKDYGLSQSNVKMILSRGRDRLRQALEREGVSV